MVTIYLPAHAAEAAIQRRRLKLRWTMCRIKEKFDPKFCNKCQNFGHELRDCKTTTPAKKKCMNCGDVSHASKE